MSRVCAQCGRPIEMPVRDFKGHSDGIRLASDVWLAHFEADPYCSTECAKAAHAVVMESQS